jgi:hypothetical protein
LFFSPRRPFSGLTAAPAREAVSPRIWLEHRSRKFPQFFDADANVLNAFEPQEIYVASRAEVSMVSITPDE